MLPRAFATELIYPISGNLAGDEHHFMRNFVPISLQVTSVGPHPYNSWVLLLEYGFISGFSVLERNAAFGDTRYTD